MVLVEWILLLFGANALEEAQKSAVKSAVCVILGIMLNNVFVSFVVVYEMNLFEYRHSDSSSI